MAVPASRIAIAPRRIELIITASVARHWRKFRLTATAAVDRIWAKLAKAERTTEQEARYERRVEVSATGSRKLNANLEALSHRPVRPQSDSGFGHLGVFPSQIVAEWCKDIRVIRRQDSPNDCSRIYRVAAQTIPSTPSIRPPAARAPNQLRGALFCERLCRS